MEGVTFMEYFDTAITTLIALSMGGLYSLSKNHFKKHNADHKKINTRLDKNEESDLLVQRDILTDRYYKYFERGYVYIHERRSWIEKYDRYKQPLPSGKVGNTWIDDLRKKIDEIEIKQ